MTSNVFLINQILSRQRRILKACHFDLTSGHMGVIRTCRVLERKVRPVPHTRMYVSLKKTDFSV